jgi:hypothetical protein
MLFTEGSLYLIDTSALVNIRDLHNDSEEVWQAVLQSIEGRRTLTVRHVCKELEALFPDIYRRVKPLKKRFVVPDALTYTADVKAEVRAIRQAHPRLYDPVGTGNPADPWLIAVAKSLPAIVVSDEKKEGNRHRRKIPFVCTSRNVGHEDRLDFLRKIGVNV